MKSISQISRKLGLTMSLLLAIIVILPVHADNSIGHSIPNANDVILKFGLPSKDSLPNRMNILIWNLHKGSDKTFATDFISLASEKDLVLSQEMYLTPLMRTVFDNFPDYFYASATSFFFGKELTRTGVATAGPVYPTSIDYIRTETLEPVLNSPKITLITHYPIFNSTKELTVVNIHGINFVTADSYRKEINRIYETLKNIKGPLIFAGDFNSWDDERNRVLKEMSQKLKLHEAHFFPDYRLTFNKHPLDHFYYTNDIKIVSAKAEDFYQGSDHKPLEVVIEYSPQ